MASEAVSPCDGIVPDIVVTDLALGGARRDGFWLLTQLRNHETCARAPVVTMTGRYFDASWRHQHTLDAVLVKPIDPIHLAALVADLVDRTRPIT